MNWEAVRDRVLSAVDLPALVLMLLMSLALWVIWRAQRNGKFDFSEMLRDENGKPSGLRLSVLGAFAVSSWVLMREALEAGPLDPQVYFVYLATWSGALVFVKGVEKWDGKLPWSKS
jgi:hypothetical protein